MILFWLDRSGEELLLRYLDPTSRFTPAEAHALAQALLQAYRNAAVEGQHLSLRETFASLLDSYEKYVKSLKDGHEVNEAYDIFEWWREKLALPALQGLLLLIPIYGVQAAAVFKLLVVVAFHTHQAWNRREMRKMLVTLEEELRHSQALDQLGERVHSRVTERAQDNVWFSSPEVEALASVLLEARMKVYGL